METIISQEEFYNRRLNSKKQTVIEAQVISEDEFYNRKPNSSLSFSHPSSMTNIEKIDFKLEKIKEILSKNTLNIDKYKEIATALYEKIGKKELVEEWQVDWMKELREQGKSYEDLAKISGLSLSSIRYHLVEGEKEKMIIANSKNREKMRASPSAWKAYTEYQKEYQRKLAQERKKSAIIFESGLREKTKSNETEINNKVLTEEKPKGFFSKTIGKIINKRW